MPFEVFYMQIVSLGLLVLTAHYASKITRRLHLGEVIGQVLGGLLVGPLLLFFLESRFPAYRSALRSLHFFTFVFLSLIAFGIGDELSFDKLKAIGRDVLLITFIQGGVTWLFVSLTFLLIGFPPIQAFIIGSIGIATAPAATFVIMNKLGITGRLRNILGGIVVLDDVIEIIIFSVFIQVALAVKNSFHLTAGKLVLPVAREMILAFLLGFIVFAILRIAIERRWLKSREPGRRILGPEFLSRLISELPGPSVEVFIIVAGVVSLGIGLAMHFHLPFLITAVTAGIFISNFYSRDVFKSLSIENATSMYSLLFFALIGANIEMESFHPENFIFIAAYIAARSAGKIGGTWLGCKITRQDMRLTQMLPRLMLPQAGVAAVEAFFVAAVLGKEGSKILGIILPGLIFFEIAGILTSERTLIKWRSWETGGGDLLEGEETLIRNKISREKINISELIMPGCLQIPFLVSSKGEAIWKLIQMLEIAGLIDNPGEVLQIILEREKQGGITLGEGVAILHGRLPQLVRPILALGVLPPDKSIDFDGTIDEPVFIIYMVLSPAEHPELHLQVLAGIAKLLSDPDMRLKLRHARSETEAMEIIGRYSKDKF
ncbi:MAG: PTS sugar transporter subunit IIA [Candidatus Aureabacteria bacterium]|nr:PTS sugar transporter subunit IIA [Candidatus Auribacterota bacterium]